MKENFKNISFDGEINITLDKKTGRMWNADKRSILNAIINVCEDYRDQGYNLTLRQMYYQLVAKDLIPNHDKVYKKLSSLKDEVVYSGHVDWDVFEDRGRVPKIAYYEDDIQSALEKTKDYYRLDRQEGQPNHIEVWTEKDAISDILKRVTHKHTIRLVVNKGYSSSTAMYSAYCRFMYAIGEGKKVVILYFGDHDPSGLDMIRDIRERILFFMANGEQKEEELAFKVDWSEDPVYMREIIDHWAWDSSGQMTDDCYDYRMDDDCYDGDPDEGGGFDVDKAFFKHHFTIKPIGLTMEQIQEYNPPHNPAKLTDPRAKWYVERFGQRSWEVDALKPSVMTNIVSNAILDVLDVEVQNQLLKKEEEDQKKIADIIDDLNDIEE